MTQVSKECPETSCFYLEKKTYQTSDEENQKQFALLDFRRENACRQVQNVC